MTEERELFYIRAMYEGLREAMLEDSAVTVIGEDVDRSIIGATKGRSKNSVKTGSAIRRSPKRRSPGRASGRRQSASNLS